MTSPIAFIISPRICIIWGESLWDPHHAATHYPAPAHHAAAGHHRTHSALHLLMPCFRLRLGLGLLSESDTSEQYDDHRDENDHALHVRPPSACFTKGIAPQIVVS
jgi:hypothetical protein